MFTFVIVINFPKIGGAEFDVSAKGPNGEDVKLDANDNGDGTYTVEYAPETAGERIFIHVQSFYYLISTWVRHFVCEE